MSTRSQYGLIVVAAAVILAVLILVRPSRAVPPSDVEHPQAQARERPGESTPHIVPVATRDPVRTTKAVTFAGFPVDIAQDPARRYAFAKDCAKFNHFDAFYRERAADPTWPLNSPEALAAADPDLRSKLMETSRFLEQHRESCTPWLKTTPQDLVNAQIYEAALQAALRGDQNAAACFVMAAWPTPSEESPYYADLTKAYAINTRRFVEGGIRTGSWPTVLAAYQAAREEHGLRTRAGFSAQDIYLLARLAQLGSPDALNESQYGYHAAEVARDLTASNLISLDKRASDLFANQFMRKKVSAQSVADMCIN